MVYTRSNSTGPKAVAALLSLWRNRILAPFRRSEKAAISPMFALMLIPIAGSIAFAVELAGFNYVQRSAQNAADSAAIAAATVNSGAATTGSTSLNEARAAARPYGYINGQDNVAVNSGVVTCPTGTQGTSPVCYEAVITTTFPLTFSRVVGFLGSGGSGNQTISARAIATAGGGGGGATTSPCYWALSTDPSALTGHGIPFANLTGCSVFSNGGIDCTGHDMGADYALAALASSRPDCARPLATGDTRTPPVDKYGFQIPPDPYAGDPYSSLASTALSKPCTSGAPTQGTTNLNLIVYCSGLAIGANKTLTLNAPNTVVVIKGGSLDMSAVNSKIITGTGASATLIFANNPNPFGTQNIKGTIDIKAPDATSGSPWKGVAIYRPSTGPDTSAVLAGSQATWKITGLVYLPHVNVTVDGVVNKSTGGSVCFLLMANIITINGNGTILNTLGGCDAAGLDPIDVTVGTATRVKLVF